MATTGNLAEMSIPAIVQSVCLERATARLMVKSPDGEAAIYCDVGEIVHCKFGQSAGPEALHRVLCWEKGIFRLDVGVPPPARTVTGSWRSHLMQAMVDLDHLRQQGTLENQPRPASGAVANAAGAAQAAPPPTGRPAPEKPGADGGETVWVQRIQAVSGVQEVVVVNSEGSAPRYAPPEQREEEAALVAYIGNAALQMIEGLGLKSLQRISIAVGGVQRTIFACGECYLGLRLAAKENVTHVALEVQKILDERKA